VVRRERRLPIFEFGLKQALESENNPTPARMPPVLRRDRKDETPRGCARRLVGLARPVALRFDANSGFPPFFGLDLGSFALKNQFVLHTPKIPSPVFAIDSLVRSLYFSIFFHLLPTQPIPRGQEGPEESV